MFNESANFPDDARKVGVAEEPQVFAVRARRVKDPGAPSPEGRRQSEAQGELRARHDRPDVVRVREVVGLDLGLIVDVARIEADAASALGVQRVRRYRVARLEKRATPPQSLKVEGLVIFSVRPSASSLDSRHLLILLF